MREIGPRPRSGREIFFCIYTWFLTAGSDVTVKHHSEVQHEPCCRRETAQSRVKSVRNFMWKLCYRKDDRVMRPIRGCPENFRDTLTKPTATIPKIFHGFLFRSTLWMFLQNLKSIALPVSEIIGVPKKFGQSLDAPTLHFLQNF